MDIEEGKVQNVVAVFAKFRENCKFCKKNFLECRNRRTVKIDFTDKLNGGTQIFRKLTLSLSSVMKYMLVERNNVGTFIINCNNFAGNKN